MLKYSIMPFDRAIAFQITAQTPEVAAFLESIGGTYRASNGYVISTKEVPAIYPDQKIILLQGSDKSRNLTVDRIYNLDSDRQRDLIIADVTYALLQFEVACKRWETAPTIFTTWVRGSVASKTTESAITLKGKNDAGNKQTLGS